MNICLSLDGACATYKGVSHGTAISAAPIKVFQGVGRYFEIKVTEVRPGQPDGLAVGVTTRRPSEILSMPAHADGLKPAWLIVFDGATWNSTLSEVGYSDWVTRDIRIDDTVGVLVTEYGALSIFVNQ